MSHSSQLVDTDVKLRSAVPTFLVADVAATGRWYVENLGFTLTGHVPREEPYVYASLMRGNAELMLLNLADYKKPDLTARRPDGLWDAYIRMSGVRELYETVEGKPFVRMALTKQSYGDLEFEVRDPNGYILVFGGD
ncbi:MAG TPA: VOC family protein [Gemmatimonadaceae bacterium]